MTKTILNCLFILILATLLTQAQEPNTIQSMQERALQQANLSETTLTAYTKWRTDTLPNYAQGLLTPHYAVVIAAQRLDDSTAQVEVLIAADMKHFTVSIRPVTLNRLPSGETESVPAGNAVTIDQKAGDKFGTGSDKTRIGQTTTTVPISKAAQALEISWTPKNDNNGDFANTCIVRLGKEPEVVVNGYVIGTPIR